MEVTNTILKEFMNTEIQKAVEVLRQGGVILYPTDTVWGIGCDATNPEAVAKVYAIKKREDSKSLVLLASDMDTSPEKAIDSHLLSALAQQTMKTLYWITSIA